MPTALGNVRFVAAHESGCGTFRTWRDVRLESVRRIEADARAAARKQCKGDCATTVTMKRACAAFAVDMANPCGAHGYAVKPHISSSLNAATRKCYEFGGKECVIRAWACDAKG